MKSYRQYGGGVFLKKEDVTPEKNWTISDVKEQIITAIGKLPEARLVLYFAESHKGLVLNRTNGDVLFEMTGSEDPAGWIGTRVCLYVDDNVPYAGKKVGGIRLRKPKNEPF